MCPIHHIVLKWINTTSYITPHSSPRLLNHRIMIYSSQYKWFSECDRARDLKCLSPCMTRTELNVLNNASKGMLQNGMPPLILSHSVLFYSSISSHSCPLREDIVSHQDLIIKETPIKEAWKTLGTAQKQVRIICKKTDQSLVPPWEHTDKYTSLLRLLPVQCCETTNTVKYMVINPLISWLHKTLKK